MGERITPSTIQFLFILTASIFHSIITPSLVGATAQELLKGFTATPDPSISSFQPILSDSTGNFSLGFLRVNRTQLALTVIHVPSSEPLWLAATASSARWSEPTKLSFNGSLVLSDPHTRLFWSTSTSGDRVFLSNTSNLQILDDSRSVLWQSFNYPTNTLVENQNFTAQMQLASSNGVYQMRLGDTFIGLYAKFNRDSEQIYWKHKALQAKANIVVGLPIYARVNSEGFLGMYQFEETPVDVQSFSSFQIQVPGIRLLRLEQDGNLKGYFWNGSNWVLDYQAISEQCQLPEPCGLYSLCQPGKGCSCLDNQTAYSSSECRQSESGDFCGGGGSQNKFSILRRKGVELPHKDLMGYEKMASLDQCERSCEMNCSCWSAVYNNVSGFCYKLDYPTRTLLAVDDDTKSGYFKEKGAERKREVGFVPGFGLLGGAILVTVGFFVFMGYRFWKTRRAIHRFDEGTVISPGPYKDLASASFRSIELSNR